MAKKFEILTYEVEGTGEFPIDMLRYDSAWPYSADDALKISLQPHDGDAYFNRHTVRLSTYSNNDRWKINTPARWRSFSWEVVS